MKSKRYIHIEAVIGKTENFLPYVYENVLTYWFLYVGNVAI